MHKLNIFMVVIFNKSLRERKDIRKSYLLIKKKGLNNCIK